MKKFLFTLLTLFMASSAFAEGGNYFYMDNFKVVKTKLGTTTAKVTVKGHFDNYVSAWQFDLGYVNENGEVVMNQLPKGVTKLTSAAGTDMKNMTYRGDDGEVYSDYSPNLKKGQDGTRIIVASDQADYSPEGEQYGPVKWVPGEYNQMWTFTFTCDADFTGAELVMRTAAACGNDTRPDVANNRATGVAVNAPNNCVVSVEYIAPEPVLTWDENNYIMTATLPEGYNAADYEIVMMANGVEVQNTYTVAQTSEDQTIEFTAYTKHAADETYDSNDATYGKQTKQTVTVPAKVETDLPFEATVKVNHTGDENNFYLLYRTEGADPDQNPEVTVTVTVDGTPSTNVEFLQNWTLVQDDTDPDNGYMKAIYNHVKLTEPGEHIVKVELTVAPGPGYVGEPKTASAEWKYTINNKFQGEIVFGDVDPTTGKMSVTYTGTEEGYTMSISLNGQDAEVDENGMIQLQEGENKIIVTLTKAGYDMKTAEANPTWTKPTPKDLTGEIVVSEPDANGVVTVTYTGDEDVTITVNGEPLAESYQLEDGVPMEFNVVVSAEGYNDLTAKETRTWNKPVPKEFAGTITVSDPDENGVVTVTYTPGEGDPENYTVTVNGEPLAESYQLEDGVPMEFNVVVSAEGYNDLTAKETRTWNKPVPKEFAGTITVSDPDENGVVTVTYTPGEGDPENYTVTVNGEPLAESYQLEDGVPMEFNVVVSAEGYKDLTAKETRTWTKPTPKELTGEITFSVTQGNKNNEAAGIVTATYNGPETGVTVKIVGDPTKVTAATSEGVRLPDYGTYKVMAVATAEGYADLDGEGEVTWDEPQTDAPEFNVSQDGLTVEATGKGTVKLYIVNADGSETEIDNPTAFDQKDEAYEVTLKAVAHVDGAKDGVATKTITIPAKSTEPGTGVNELVDGKAVKSVRYFNMAGQEMQEVNGVTIVVTTYTDGTTSAVKVMK